MKIAVAGVKFECSLILFVTYLAVMLVLINLGLWQLSRADEKKMLLQQQQKSGAQPVIDAVELPTLEMEKLRYRQLKIQGKYDAVHQFLIDNQVVNGQVGYFVVTPFIFVAGNDRHKEAVLINRGWLRANKDRRVLPQLPIKNTKATVKGRINHFPSVGIRLAGAEIPSEGWPSVVQVVDQELLSKKLGYEILPFQLELDPESNEGYQRVWKQASVMPPEKHIAYAVQWFGLAVTLTILLIWFSRKINE